MTDLSLSQEGDAALVARAREGDASAFGALVERHERDAMAAAIGFLGSRSEAEDAAQEAFVRAWSKLETLRDPSRFKAWLGGILIRFCHDRLRRLARERRAAGVMETGHEEVPADTRDIIQETLALPLESREVLVLFYLQGLDVGELAEALGISPANAKVRLHRGRRMLRERMEAKGK